VLDHVAMTAAAAAGVRSIDAVHVNSEFADQASDHDPLVALSCADITAPSLTVSLSQSSLSPPNHKYVRVTASTPTSDTVDPSPSVTLVSAVSSEPDDAPGAADGTTTHDVSIIDPHTFDLRAGAAPGARTRSPTARPTPAATR
jgi:hypothetical protein